MENWTKVSFNSNYEVSDLGNLRNSKNQIIKPQLNKSVAEASRITKISETQIRRLLETGKASSSGILFK